MAVNADSDALAERAVKLARQHAREFEPERVEREAEFTPAERAQLRALLKRETKS